jgi:hypothetical protein
MAIQRITKNDQSNDNSKNSEKSFILKVMEDEFGYTAANSIISHVARTSMKSKSEILSDYDTFSNILKQVYTEEVAEKEILDRLSSFGLSQKI